MPYKGHKSVTITEENDNKLSEIKKVLGEKSNSSTANKIIQEKHTSLINTSVKKKKGFGGVSS